MDLTNWYDIQDLMEQFRLFPDKSKGQNFLIDRDVLEEIIAVADLKKDDLVLEIGPGLGVLTAELAKRVKKVLAVEFDKRLIRVLEFTLKKFKNVEILNADILKIKNEEIKKLLGGDYKLISNLPYNLTGRVLRKFLSYQPKPTMMVLMLQKEVAKRLTAKAGEMSLVGLQAQFYGEPEIAFLVDKKSFYPVPEVDSAIVKILGLKERTGEIKALDEDKFWQIAKIGFSARRKQLKNNLAAGLKIDKSEVEKCLKIANLEPLIRAEDLNLSQWLKLSKMF